MANFNDQMNDKIANYIVDLTLAEQKEDVQKIVDNILNEENAREYLTELLFNILPIHNKPKFNHSKDNFFEACGVDKDKVVNLANNIADKIENDCQWSQVAEDIYNFLYRQSGTSTLERVVALTMVLRSLYKDADAILKSIVGTLQEYKSTD